MSEPNAREVAMIFNFNEEEFLELPAPETVQFKLSELDFEEFAILESGEERYIQVYRHEDDSYQLEYRAGSEEQHFESVNHNGLSDVQEAFVRYLAELEDWHSKWTWQPVDFDDDNFTLADE